ncbi:hypothetical protein OPKNFCMD_3244 [Methylobacterium crusticola]|uniref:SciE type virulence protein n=1 Tax=Methylobacterium crusticola TaxID=1697972 RepID=A0ABQ4QZP0_9HYPH|nr:type VI secretion system accessory protein TagJ [Methylobacterium crusticola]GJD50501.1 hypothetical protein OPKNFCMD_3244 [Methylobacterium crusticola]
MTESAIHLFEAGRLREALAAATNRVRAAPGDIGLRSELAEFLCLSGELERAERQFDAIAAQAPMTAPRVTELRQFVRAGLARDEVWRDGRAPELLGPAPDHLRLRLEALIHLREGDAERAAARVGEAEAARPAVAGTRDGRPFDDWRDMDDLIGGVLEVMSPTGKYFWVALEQVNEAVVEPPRRPIDAGWCTMELSVKDGPTGRVVVPAIYPVDPNEGVDDGARLGRETNWIERPGGWVSGRGLRCFLVGEESVAIRDLGTLSFEGL